MAGENEIEIFPFSPELNYVTLSFMLAIFVFFWTRWKDPLRGIPGPCGWPILGNTLEFTASTDQHSLLLKWTKQYGKIFKYYVLFGGYRVHVSDPVVAKHVLVTNCKNYRRHDVLKKLLPGLGNGLITTNGYEHAVQRKQLNPFFSLAKIQRFFPVFVCKTNELIKLWKQERRNAMGHKLPCEMLEKLTHVSLDIIGLCAFGYDFNCILVGETEESRATDTVLKGKFDLRKRSLERMFPPLKLMRTKCEQEFFQAEKCLQNLIEMIIKENQTRIGDQVGRSVYDGNLLGVFSSMKNKNGDRLSPEDIYHHVFTFLVSGHETISLAGTWTLYLLAKYPEIQSNLRREIRETIGNREIKWTDLENLKLLDNCIKEALRLYPIALTTDRTSVGPDVLGPYRIPAGTHVMIGNGTLHRDETFWADANMFRPNRFDKIDEEELKLMPYYFLPFSRGPRMCIGFRFAMTGLKVLLAKLLQNFAFTFKGEECHSNSIPEFGSISTLTLKPFPVLDVEMELVDEASA